MAAAAPGLASDQFASSFQLNHLKRGTSVSTGFKTLMTWSDPGEPGGAPKAIQEIDIKLPRGSALDTRALAACAATDDEIKSEGATACPPESVLGSGHTDAVLGAAASFHTDVTLFNAPGQIIVLVTLAGTTSTITEFRDEVAGRAITVKPVLPSGVSLTRLNLRVSAHSKGTGKQRRAYLTTPSKCRAAGEWTTRATFTYVDATTERLKSTSPCARPR